MHTIYDWVTVAGFAALVTLFLSRSARAEGPDDSLWRYFIPAAGCGLANWLGNNGQDLAAAGVIAASIAFVIRYLHLFPAKPGD